MADDKKKKAGRKGKYDTHVLPFFDRIEKMLNEGASEKQVAEALGVSYPAWNNYKVQYPALGELCSKPRTELVDKLRSALVKRALGYNYEVKKVYIDEDEKGNKKKHTEIFTKHAMADVTAIFGALNIYDPDYVKDRKAHELKEQELELRRMIAETKDF